MNSEVDLDPLTAIIALCSEILAIEHISAGENFFAMGGNSLNAVELTEALHAERGLWLPLEAVFECETLSELASRCRKNSAANSEIDTDG
jgi:myxalamid-type nonribosomal peptide synthetase MxaA